MKKNTFELKELILENKEIKKAYYKKKYFDFVCNLREWCYEHSCIASKKVIDKFSLPDVELIEIDRADITAKLYKNFKTGSLCDGIAWFLAQVYNLFELKATTYNFGLTSIGLTHFVTIVKVPDVEIYSIQDAYFNVYYIYNDNPANFLELMRYTKLDKWGIVRGRKKYRYALICPSEEFSYLIKKKIEFTWKNAEKWFDNMVNKYKISITNFFELIFMPLKYSPISEVKERTIINYLKKLSNKYNTNLKFGIQFIDPKSLAQSFSKEIEQLKLKKIETVTLYGYKGYGQILLKCLKNYFHFHITIVDGNKNLQGHHFSGVLIRPVEDLSVLKSDLIIICSIAHEATMIENVKRFRRDQEFQLITIKKLLKNLIHCVDLV